MSNATGIIFLTGGITAANEVLFAPLATGQPTWKAFNWRIIPATGIAALALGGLDKVAPKLGTGIAVIALVTVVITRMGNAPAPIENVAKVMGYQK